MKNLILILSLSLFVSASVAAQPRPAQTPNSGTSGQTSPARDSYAAIYEGGMFGASRREKGSFRIDEPNERLVFHRQDGREMFSIPFSSMLVIYPDSKKSTSKTGEVMSRVPLPGAPLWGLMSKRTQYLVLHFDDPDVDAQGVANFKFDDRALLIDFIRAAGEKAKMLQKGDAYYRARTRRADY